MCVTMGGRRVFLLTCVFLLCFTRIQSQNVSLLNNSTRTGKVVPWILPPYSLIPRVARTRCTAVSGLDGICSTVNQCNNEGGVGASREGCPNKAVCCIFQYTCGGNTAAAISYFRNPANPTGRCTFTVNRQNDDVCQVRLDFIVFDLLGPTPAGVCADDFLLLKDANIRRICGTNQGQHIYLMFPAGCNSQEISIDVNANRVYDRSWVIRVTQIACASVNRVLDGCLQYYTGTSGTVTSFNYADTPPLAPQNGGSTRLISSTMYGVCIRQNPGYCAIEWSQSGDSRFTFSVSGDTEGETIGGIVGVPRAGTECEQTFVVIANPTISQDSQLPQFVDRFCGNSFETMRTSTTPFILHVVTGMVTDLDVANRGFRLNFRQIPC